MSDSRQQGNKAPGFAVSPRLAGVVVTTGVIALPGIPVGYLAPFAIFLGLWTVFVMETRKYRREAAGRRISVDERSQVSNMRVADLPEVVRGAGEMATGKMD